MIRTSAFAVALALLATSAYAQDVEELKKRRDAKLAEAWLKSAPWITDFDKAKDEAFDQEKLIFAYFTRSYSP